MPYCYTERRFVFFANFISMIGVLRTSKKYVCLKLTTSLCKWANYTRAEVKPLPIKLSKFNSEIRNLCPMNIFFSSVLKNGMVFMVNQKVCPFSHSNGKYTIILHTHCCPNGLLPARHAQTSSMQCYFAQPTINIADVFVFVHFSIRS